MSIMSVGDMAQSYTLSRSGAAMKSDLTRLSSELTSGLAEDTAAHLVGDFGPFAGIEASLARLTGYKSVTAEAGLFTESMQSALSLIGDMASDLGQALLAGATTSTPGRIASLGAEAFQKLDTTLAALNTRIGDRSLFAGTETTTTPLPTGTALMDTLVSVTAGTGTVDDVETALDDWFSSASGFGAAYRGGPALVGVAVAPGEMARIEVTAADPAIRDTLKGFAMTALLDRGLLSSQPDARARIVQRSGEVLAAAQTGRSELTARLGTTQGQIEQAAQRNTAETSALEIARSGMLSIDPYEVASRLQQTETQLETLYTLTSRLSRLSLVNFL
jgi:flagellar hook-associated protein 3 FlgL